MSLRANLLKSRSHIAFVLGLSLAATFALSVESRVNLDRYRSDGQVLIRRDANPLELAPSVRLRNSDYKNAHIAWGYFVKNYQPETGLVNSVDGFPSTTIWDQASYLLGLISAERIGVIDRTVFDQRMDQVLKTLAALPLFDNKLPNKAYDTRSLDMVDYTNAPVVRGVGWSALDVARMTVPLNIVLYDYPQHSARAANILTGWDFSAMLKDGTLHGARIAAAGDKVEVIQEGRLGYEEYAARAIGLLGLDALTAAKYDDYLRFETIGGQSIAIDSRSYSEFDAHKLCRQRTLYPNGH